MIKVKCSRAGSLTCCKGCFHSEEHEKRLPKVGAWNNSSECDFLCGNDIDGYGKCEEVVDNV